MDQWLLESMSSGCAIVGFFIGYSVAMGKATSRLCGSRVHEAETTIDWMMMPPMIRPDDLEIRTEESKTKRQKAGPSSGDAQGSADTDVDDEDDPNNPFGVDYSV